MAWNQPGEDKKRPTQRGGGGDASLDQMLRRWQERVQRLWRPGRGGGTAALTLLLVAAAVWAASGYYQIGASQRGIVERFGRYVATEQPGNRWHWPWPIETVTKLSLSGASVPDAKAMMLTADQYLISINYAVQYRISDPLAYMFDVRDPETTLRETSDAVVRELVARSALTGLLQGEARVRVAADARARMQQLLDRYGAGISVTGVVLSDAQLPDPVVATQRDTVKASEEHDRLTADAQAYASDIVSKAQVAAEKTLADAQVYATQTEANAEAEAERIGQVEAVYAQAPEVTRERLYIETMESIFTHAHKVFVDTKNGNGVIYLPLDKLAQTINGSAAAAASAPPNATETPPAGEAAGAARGDQDTRSRERGDR
jgi:modulator of FtsH protease HflK